jgi:hypothetical protein
MTIYIFSDPKGIASSVDAMKNQQNKTHQEMSMHSMEI